MPNSPSLSVHSASNILKLCLFGGCVLMLFNTVKAQEAAQNTPKLGYEVVLPTPLDATSATQLVRNLTKLAESAPADRRTTVVLKLQSDSASPEQTAFEDALKVARAITSPKLRRLKIVSFVDGEISGHVVL